MELFFLRPTECLLKEFHAPGEISGGQSYIKRRFTVFSLELISASNGWSMALAGALIVMSGLAVLSFIISQLPRLVDLMEKKEAPEETTVSDKAGLPEKFPADIHQAAALYEPLIKQLPASFGLGELYALSRKNDYPHPHLSLRAFRTAGILVSQGGGQFSWNSQTGV